MTYQQNDTLTAWTRWHTNRMIPSQPELDDIPTEWYPHSTDDIPTEWYPHSMNSMTYQQNDTLTAWTRWHTNRMIPSQHELDDIPTEWYPHSLNSMTWWLSVYLTRGCISQEAETTHRPLNNVNGLRSRSIHNAQKVIFQTLKNCKYSQLFANFRDLFDCNAVHMITTCCLE